MVYVLGAMPLDVVIAVLNLALEGSSGNLDL